MTYPKGLKKGDKVALVSPARFVHPEAVERAAERMRSFGYEPVIYEQNFMNYSVMAGEDNMRADALNQAFADKEIKAIWCMRGGYGSPRLLDKLDYDLIKKNPKIFIGSSDITALLSAIQTQTGLVTFHGPMQMTYELNETELAVTALKDLLENPKNSIELRGSTVIKNTNAPVTGKILGGNLHLLQSLIGTNYEPDWQNALLYIEDTDEHKYALERILLQFKHRGVFDKISALLVAKTHNLGDYAQGFDKSEENLFGQFVEDRNIPYLFNVPCGHGGNMLALPFGAHATLDLAATAQIHIDTDSK